MALPYFLITNKLRTATVLSEMTMTDHGIANALDGRTSTQAGFGASMTRTVVFDFGSAVTFTHFGFVGTSFSGVIAFDWSNDNSSYGSPYEIEDPEAVYCAAFATPLTYRYLRVHVYFHSVDVYLSDLFVGEAIELPYDVPFGFVQPEWADEDLVESNMTGSGAIVGVTVTRRPKKTTVDMRDYPVAFFTTNWDELISGLKEYPGYFKWSDAGAPMFCALTGKTPRPAYSSHMHLNAKLDLEGFVE